MFPVQLLGKDISMFCNRAENTRVLSDCLQSPRAGDMLKIVQRLPVNEVETVNRLALAICCASNPRQFSRRIKSVNRLCSSRYEHFLQVHSALHSWWRYSQWLGEYGPRHRLPIGYTKMSCMRRSHPLIVSMCDTESYAKTSH